MSDIFINKHWHKKAAPNLFWDSFSIFLWVKDFLFLWLDFYNISSLQYILELQSMWVLATFIIFGNLNLFPGFRKPLPDYHYKKQILVIFFQISLHFNRNLIGSFTNNTNCFIYITCIFWQCDHIAGHRVSGCIRFFVTISLFDYSFTYLFATLKHAFGLFHIRRFGKFIYETVIFINYVPKTVYFLFFNTLSSFLKLSFQNKER